MNSFVGSPFKWHDADKTVGEGWRAQFDAFIASRMNVPFEWGTNDCCMFAADAALVITGIDFAVDERGAYATAFSAASRVVALGCLSKIADNAGAQIPALSAAIGDIGLVELDGREMLAVCCGNVWMAPGKDGLCAIDLRSAKLAWRLTRG